MLHSEPICPVCGGPLMDSRGKLVCPSNDHPRYEETCCEGDCGCASTAGAIEGAEYEEPNGEGN